MASKTTHFGRAGEFFAMSEFLLRGWNVAVPVVDVGDDVFVIDDNDKTTYRLQVKSAEPKERPGARYSASFSLSRKQLDTISRIELFYMLLIRVSPGWRYLVFPRDELAAIREAFEKRPREGRGRPPTTDGTDNDKLSLVVDFDEHGAMGWGVSLNAFLDQWPDQLPDLG